MKVTKEKNKCYKVKLKQQTCKNANLDLRMEYRCTLSKHCRGLLRLDFWLVWIVKPRFKQKRVYVSLR